MPTVCLYSCGDAPTADEFPPPVTFRVAGDSQIQFPSSVLRDNLRIQLIDANGDDTPTSGVLVTWTVSGGGGELDHESDLTSSIGHVSNSWTLGANEGLNQVRVDVGSSGSYVFDAWAANAGPIAFASTRRNPVQDHFMSDPTDVYVMNSDGSNVILLSPAEISHDWLEGPSWSPDGTAFVVSFVDGTQQDIFRVDIATGEAVNLTNGVGLNLESAWRR